MNTKNMNDDKILVSGPIIFRGNGKMRRWLITKNEKDGPWEIPKVSVRRAESSVRAAMRMMGEQGAMDIQVLEEAGRSGGTTTVNGKVLAQRKLYYLALYLGGGEVLGFIEAKWLPYAKVTRKLSKQEAMMVRSARKELVVWERKKREEERLERLKAKASEA